MQYKGHSQTQMAGSGVSGLKWMFAILTLVILTGLFTVTARADQPLISKVDVKDFGDVVQITVSSNSPLAVHDGRLGERYLVFDLYGRLSPEAQKRVNIDSGGIKLIRCGWYQDTPPVARIAVATTGARNYSVKADRGQCLTTIKIRKQGTTPPAVTEKPVPGGAEQAVQAAMPVAIAQARPEQKAPRLVSLDFVGSDIHDVIKALAVQGGVNIVAGPEVKGNVTVSLSKVTVEEALKLVANISGFQYQLIEGTYVVGTDANMKAMAATSLSPEQKSTEYVVVTHGDAATIGKMMEAQCPGVAVTSSSSDSKDAKGPAVLVLTGVESAVQAAKSLAEGIEQSLAQTAANDTIDLYEVKYMDVTEMSTALASTLPQLKVTVGPKQGFDLRCPTAVAMGASDQVSVTTPTPGADNKAQSKILLLQGNPADVEKAKALLSKMDVAQPQIMIEAKIIDLNDSDADELGIEWGDKVTGLAGTTFNEIKAVGDQSLMVGRFSRTPMSVLSTLRGMITAGKGRVLANPNVLAIDGKPSSAFVGDEVKYVIQINATLQGGTTVTTETARVGVQLHTISRINSDGYITMNLHPEVSVITRWIDTPAKISLPEISRRYVDSTVRVRDGETIVIGGLIKDEELKNMSGIPFLKDLPFIGQLFKSKSTSKTHSEIMMFITPRVLSQTM